MGLDQRAFVGDEEDEGLIYASTLNEGPTVRDLIKCA